jgi:CRISPR system Cascade subunit CasA
MIRWRDEHDELHRGSLFGAFAALARGEAWSFPALRPHQAAPWHAFTVQIAALALIRAGTDVLPADEAAWADLLLALTPDQPDGSAWQLVVDDWTRPALLQPPVVAAANRGDYKTVLPTPDTLDMLVTARNHDVKQERIVEAGEEDWLFALVTLQTGEGYSGRDNHGISRMNGGQSNRMSLGIRPGSGGAAAAFRRDVRRLVANARARPDRRSGDALVWTHPWDGTVSLDYTTLDEWYVEICRRIRLTRGAAGIEALSATSKCTRIAAKGLNGKTLDPWAPLKADDSASVTASGFGYRAMGRLLRPAETTVPLLARLHDEDDREGLEIVASALVRGQGKTEGLHRRRIPTSRVEEVWKNGPVEAMDRVGNTAKRRADDAVEASRRLRRALISLVQGGPEKARLDDDAAKKKTDGWIGQFDAAVDRAFFDDDLWAEAAEDERPHRRDWRVRLRGWAEQTFDEAARAAPRTAVRRVRAIVQARSFLDGQMTKWLQEVPDGE